MVAGGQRNGRGRPAGRSRSSIIRILILCQVGFMLFMWYRPLLHLQGPGPEETHRRPPGYRPQGAPGPRRKAVASAKRPPWPAKQQETREGLEDLGVRLKASAGGRPVKPTSVEIKPAPVAAEPPPAKAAKPTATVVKPAPAVVKLAAVVEKPAQEPARTEGNKDRQKAGVAGKEKKKEEEESLEALSSSKLMLAAGDMKFFKPVVLDESKWLFFVRIQKTGSETLWKSLLTVRQRTCHHPRTCWLLTWLRMGRGVQELDGRVWGRSRECPNGYFCGHECQETVERFMLAYEKGEERCKLLVRGHIGVFDYRSAAVSMGVPAEDLVLFTMLRDPVQRVMSEYIHVSSPAHHIADSEGGGSDALHSSLLCLSSAGDSQPAVPVRPPCVRPCLGLQLHGAGGRLHHLPRVPGQAASAGGDVIWLLTVAPPAPP